MDRSTSRVSQAIPSQTGAITGPPYITLVDIHGCPVPYAEKNIPEIQSEPCEADSWPLWTDLIRARCGARDEDHDRQAMQVLMADAMLAVLKQVDWAADSDAEFERAWAEFEASDPVPAELPESFRVPEEWNDEPLDLDDPADQVHPTYRDPIPADECEDTGEFPPVVVQPPLDLAAFPGKLAAIHRERRGGTTEPWTSRWNLTTLAGVAAVGMAIGGVRSCQPAEAPAAGILTPAEREIWDTLEPPAEIFEPTPEDWQDFYRWADDLHRRHATAEYLAGFNAVRDDASEVPA